jgi:Holliday junction DNA helicase RuvB
MSNLRPLAKKSEYEDTTVDAALRPQCWDDYVGQEFVKRNIKILIEAAKKRGEALEHILLGGPAGLGKTSMAHLIAREMNTNIRITSGASIERVGDLASILTNLLPHDILFIDEVHRLNKLLEEVLYPAMESRKLDIIIGKGPSARTLQIDLPPFTLIAATTRIGLLSGPLRSRFGATFRLDFYTVGEIAKIIRRSSQLLGIRTEEQALERIARSSRAIPRVANRLLKRVRDYTQVHTAPPETSPSGSVRIPAILATEEMTKKTLDLLAIDDLGLEDMDRRILEIIITKFNGGPVGLQSLAAASSEEEETIEEVYEPFLMKIGFIERTPRGRIATERAYQHLGLSVPRQRALLNS